MPTNSNRFVDAANASEVWRGMIGSGDPVDIGIALDQAQIVFPADSPSDPVRRNALIAFLVSKHGPLQTFFPDLEKLRERVEGIDGTGSN
jgi:hypothetical protein